MFVFVWWSDIAGRWPDTYSPLPTGGTGSSVCCTHPGVPPTVFLCSPHPRCSCVRHISSVPVFSTSPVFLCSPYPRCFCILHIPGGVPVFSTPRCSCVLHTPVFLCSPHPRCSCVLHTPVFLYSPHPRRCSCILHTPVFLCSPHNWSFCILHTPVFLCSPHPRWCFCILHTPVFLYSPHPGVSVFSTPRCSCVLHTLGVPVLAGRYPALSG